METFVQQTSRPGTPKCHRKKNKVLSAIFAKLTSGKKEETGTCLLIKWILRANLLFLTYAEEKEK